MAEEIRKPQENPKLHQLLERALELGPLVAGWKARDEKKSYPVFHACSISNKHARKIAELDFSNDFIRIFVSAGAGDNGLDMGACVHCLLSAVLIKNLAL